MEVALIIAGLVLVTTASIGATMWVETWFYEDDDRAFIALIPLLVGLAVAVGGTYGIGSLIIRLI
jgi:hypothetical protein